jgi:hypothetical protein
VTGSNRRPAVYKKCGLVQNAPMAQRRGAEGANCAVCTGDSVHEPVHALPLAIPGAVAERYSRPADQRAAPAIRAEMQ